MIVKICVHYLIIMAKLKVCIISHCLGLGNDTTVYVVYLTMFLSEFKKRKPYSNHFYFVTSQRLKFWVVCDQGCHISHETGSEYGFFQQLVPATRVYQIWSMPCGKAASQQTFFSWATYRSNLARSDMFLLTYWGVYMHLNGLGLCWPFSDIYRS